MLTFSIFIFLSIFAPSLKNIFCDAKIVDESLKFYEGDNDYGYIEVREGVFLFWWLYYAGGDKANAFEKPLIIWIQGGPGNPASAMGNFLEIGPQDLHLDDRPLSWVHKRNVLFIDSPVGTGFSYYTDVSLIVKTDDELVKDLVAFMKKFLVQIPQFETVPTHIFSQSYGGKIAPRFAYYLHNEVKAKSIVINLKSVGIGSAFVSPKDSILAFPGKVFNSGFIDQTAFEEVKKYSLLAGNAIDNGDYREGNQLMLTMMNKVPNIWSFNTFNFLKSPLEDPRPLLHELLDVTVRRALSDVITQHNLTFQYATDVVYMGMQGDMARPAVSFVEKLLNESDITIAVYSGNLDIILPLTGALKWVNNLNWPGAQEFREAKRLQIPGHRNGHYKSFDRLSFWWIYNAGHSVGDNLEAMEHILNKVINPISKNPEVIQNNNWSGGLNLNSNHRFDFRKKNGGERIFVGHE